MLPEAKRILSVMKYIAQSIPPDNRWYPIFLRYLAGLGDRVAGLGDDPDSVYPNPTGSGEPYVEPVDDGRPDHDGDHDDDGHDHDGKGGLCDMSCEAASVGAVLGVVLIVLGVGKGARARALAAIAGVAALAASVNALCRRCCAPPRLQPMPQRKGRARKGTAPREG
jgi:hypothetical protein